MNRGKKSGRTASLQPSMRKASHKNLHEWLKMRTKLWPRTSFKDHKAEIEEMLKTPHKNVTFLSFSADRKVIGFIEASLREYVDGCSTSPVGYIEGWYVVQPSRRQGIGRQLVRAAESWAASHGAKEMASDTETTNRTSQRAHVALGYRSVQRLVIFTKQLRKRKE